MKRPEITTILSPISRERKAIASDLLDFFLIRYKGTLTFDYAKVAYDDEEACFELMDENSDLTGREDLLARLERDRGCMWRCQVNTRFAASDIYVTIFSDPREPSQVTVIFSLEPAITRFLEDEDTARVPYVLFLEEIAVTVGADWFLSGLYLDKWNPLHLAHLSEEEQIHERFGEAVFPYVVGWRQGVVDEQTLLRGWKLDTDDVKRTLQGFCFISFFPNWVALV